MITCKLPAWCGRDGHGHEGNGQGGRSMTLGTKWYSPPSHAKMNWVFFIKKNYYRNSRTEDPASIIGFAMSLKLALHKLSLNIRADFHVNQGSNYWFMSRKQRKSTWLWWHHKEDKKKWKTQQCCSLLPRHKHYIPYHLHPYISTWGTL